MIKRYLLGFVLFCLMGMQLKVHAAEMDAVYQNMSGEQGIDMQETNEVNDCLVEEENIDVLNYIDSSGNFEYYTNVWDGVSINKYIGSASEVVIPSEIGGKPVNRIQSLGDNSNIVSVEIPETVTMIDGAAFKDCKNLTTFIVDENNTSFMAEGSILYSKDKKTLVRYNGDASVVEVEKGVTGIGEGAFYGLLCVEEVILPEGITELGNKAFAYCGVQKIALPDTLTSIGEECFLSSGLTEISIPESVANIEEGAFAYADITSFMIDENNEDYMAENNVLYTKDKATLLACGYNTVSIDVAEETTRIGKYAFASLGIGTVGLPDGLKEIGEYAFVSTNLSEVVIPETVVKIEEYAFWYSTVEEISVLGQNTHIGYAAFSECDKLSRAIISGGIIDGRAFYGCDWLRKVELLENVKSIGSDAFRECKLTEARILSSTCTGLSELNSTWTGTTIYGYEYSTAKSYAESDSRLTFVSLGVEPVYGEIIANDENGIPDTKLYNGIMAVADVNGDGLLTLKEANVYNGFSSLYVLGVENLKGMEYFTSITKICFSEGSITDVSPLSNLTQLTRLSLDNNRIRDISSLDKLTNLTEVYLYNNKIEDISVIKNWQKLEWIHLANNQIEDISVIVELPNLKSFWLSDNRIRKLPDMKHMELTGSQGNAYMNTKISGNRITDEEAQAKLPECLLEDKLWYSMQQFYTFADNFADVSEGEWYYDAVEYAYSNFVMSGKADTVFDPAGKLTRAEFVTALYSLKKKPDVTYSKIFNDVPEEKWYTEPIIWAYNSGVTSGYGDVFGVNDSITREQLALMLYSFAKENGYDTIHTMGAIDNYSDKNEVSDWAEEAINWAVTHGIISGKGSGSDVSKYKLDPNGSATRAECAAMLKKLLEK